MNLIHEDLARAHIDARLVEARELRRSRRLISSRRREARLERDRQRSRAQRARVA